MVLSIENWERFVLSIGLEIERPDFAVDFDMIGILTSPRVQESELEYVLTSILSLIGQLKKKHVFIECYLGREFRAIHAIHCAMLSFSRIPESYFVGYIYACYIIMPAVTCCLVETIFFLFFRHGLPTLVSPSWLGKGGST